MPKRNSMSNNVVAARGALGAASRHHPEEVEAARRNLAAAKLEQYITAVVAKAPPLTDEQAAKISALLRVGR